ncbi:MAG: ATP-binding protein [Anaerolineae bacterium]|nr:ATP-binding protein [Anaerolineae bacterium]
MDEDILARQALKKAFSGIPDLEVEKLLASGGVAHYPPGTVLCQEDAIEDTFYIILGGEVKVTKVINDLENRLLKRLGTGDFFGEMGIIHNAPRAATVSTTTNTAVLEIRKDSFEQLLNQSTSVSLAMVREVSRRLRENDEMAIEDLRLKAGELAQAYQQLAELELARREFLTTIAHELRTPLTSAAGFMQVIRLGMMEGETLKGALNTVSRNIDQIVTLMNDILFLQEMELILSEFTPVDIGAVVAASVEAERVHSENTGVAINLSIAPNLPFVPGDAKNLERAFTAIINNAIKFTLNEEPISIVVDYNPSYVWVKILDRGIGIPPGNMLKIYDRFFRTEEFNGHLFGGVGLGLSIARQVIEQHGGEIEVHSEVGRGTIFTIHLKLRHGPKTLMT